MANHGTTLDAAYHALSDATRRAVIERLVAGPATISELAEPHAITLPTFMKHFRVLEDSGLVRSEKRGRVRTCYLEPLALRSAEAWFSQQRRRMERKLDRLASLAEEMERKSKK